MVCLYIYTIHFIPLGAKNTLKQTTQKHFSDGSCGTMIAGTSSVPGTNGTKWQSYCGIKQEQASLSQGQVPICPESESRLSQGRFLFVPDTVPPKMFMFIGFFSCSTEEGTH